MFCIFIVVLLLQQSLFLTANDFKKLVLMGLLDKLVTLFGLRKQEVKVLVVGLNNSGKTTVLNHFKSEDDKSTEIVPTVGFNIEKFKSKFLLHIALSRCYSFCCVSLHFLITIDLFAHKLATAQTRSHI